MIDLTVEGAADSGQCVARADGRVVFLRGALPGEKVAVEITQRRSRFWRGRVQTVVTASPHRVQPACPWFGRCGGCDWLHADPVEQLRIKADVLRETLRRIGGIDTPVAVRSLGRQTGWRGRVTLHVDDVGRAGFHAAGSHELVAVEHCLQAAPQLALDEVLSQTWPEAEQIHVSVSAAGRSVIAGARRFGPDVHHDDVLGRRFERSVDGFWQSHIDAADVLAGAVRQLVEPAASVVDLYAGVGLFGLTVVDVMPGAAVTLVEGDRIAARYARRNAGGRARVLAVDVRRWRPEPTDLVLLDPPRAGAGAKVVEAITTARPATVIYVSCDPATLARDLKGFSQRGYTLDHLEGFDLFPGTAHVETVARLRRG